MKKSKIKLTPMQEFALALVNKENGKEVHPGYLATMWAERDGKHSKAASRDRFGHTSAAYKTLRKLCEMGLVNQHSRGRSESYSKRNKR